MLFSTTLGVHAVDSVLRVKPTGLGMEVVEREPQVYGFGNIIPTSTVTNLPVAPYGTNAPTAYNQAGVGFGVVEMQQLSGTEMSTTTWLLIGGGALAAVGGYFWWRKRQ